MLGLAIPRSQGGSDSDSFGVQQMLVSGPERARYFRVFGDVSGFVTDNVGLSRRNGVADSFLVATFGLGYQRPLKRGFQVEAGAQFSFFRYDEFGQLDFNSLDVGAGISFRAKKLANTDFSLRYNYNSLFSTSGGSSFFENHTVTIGAEKVFQITQRQAVAAGAFGRLGFAEPKVSERDELGAYVAYHLEIMARLEADLAYRYGYYRYSEMDRRDHNHSISVGLKYGITNDFSASASSFYVWNQSNEEFLSYRAGTVGGGLMFLLKF